MVRLMGLGHWKWKGFDGVGTLEVGTVFNGVTKWKRFDGVGKWEAGGIWELKMGSGWGLMELGRVGVWDLANWRWKGFEFNGTGNWEWKVEGILSSNLDGSRTWPSPTRP